MTEQSAQQKRDRAERRRKLEGFWRWACEAKPATGEFFRMSDKNLPKLCRQAIAIGRQAAAVLGLPLEHDYAMERDASLAQLDVLEMLEERVSEMPKEPVDNTKLFGDIDAIAERNELKALDDWVGYDVVRIAGSSSGKTEQIRKASKEGAVAVVYPGKTDTFQPVPRTAPEQLEGRVYDQRTDPFFHPELAKHPWEFK